MHTIKKIPENLWNSKLEISYYFTDSPFGELIVSSLPEGICYLGYVETREKALAEIRARFPNALLRSSNEIFRTQMTQIEQISTDKPLVFYLKGTPFQHKVWEALLTIPSGKVVTYSDIAKQIGSPKAQRAVGSAVGRNPIFLLIPCHRIIAQNGKIGGFYWGTELKIKILKTEKVSLFS